MKIFNFQILKAGLITRILCFLGDLSFGYYLYFYLLNFDQFASWSSLLDSSWGPVYSKIFLVFLSTQVLRFQSTLLFSLSLGQLIGGMKAVSDSFFWRRIGGGARVMLETLLILTPFDIMSIYRVSPFKEELTNVELVEKKSSFFKAVRFFFFVLLFASFQLSPILHSKELFSEVIFNEKIDEIESHFDQPEFRSEKYGFVSYRSFNELQKNHLFFPNFEFSSIGDKTKATPYIMAYNINEKTFLSWKLKHRIDLKELFSSLGDSVNLENSYNIITDSFNIKNQIFHFKMFPSGYLKIREKILGLLSSSKKVEVSFLKVHRKLFLRLEQHFSHEILESLISLNERDSLMFEFIWRNQKTQNDFYQKFLPYISWELSQTLQSNKDSINSFVLLDLLKEKMLEKERIKNIEKFLASQYYDSASIAYQTKSPHLKEFLIMNMSAFIGMFSQVSMLKEWSFSEHFKFKMREIHKKLVLDDKSFFIQKDSL